MPKRKNQKDKMLHILVWLSEASEERPVTTAQLIARLAELGISAERKAVYDDLMRLSVLGYDIRNRKGVPPGWWIGTHVLRPAELELLKEAVAAYPMSERMHCVLERKLDAVKNVPLRGGDLLDY